MNDICKRIQDELSAYIDNEATEISKDDIKQHLEKCINCQKVYHSLELSIDLVKRTTLLNNKVQHHKIFIFRPYVYAASLSVLILIFAFFKFYPAKPMSDEYELASTADFNSDSVMSKEKSSAPGSIMPLEERADFSGSSKLLSAESISSPRSFQRSVKNDLYNSLSKEINDSALKKIVSDENKLEIFCRNAAEVEYSIKEKFSKIFTVVKQKDILQISCNRKTFEKLFPLKNIETGEQKVIIQFLSK